MDKEFLPQYTPTDEYAIRRQQKRHRRRFFKAIVLLCLGYVLYTRWSHEKNGGRPNDLSNTPLSIERLRADHATCSKLRSVPTDPSASRERSARYVDGQRPVLIRNATVWTGEPVSGTTPEEARLGKGYVWINADVFLEHGLIKRVESEIDVSHLPSDHVVYDAAGRQLTTGIVDMHSHAGVDPLPELIGSSDDNELSNDITPYVRSIDGLNPLDHQIQVIKSGGVTTSLVLPGSGNNMGGEAYVIKHAVGKPDGRPEISAEDMLADPDKTWRYMKMACGENAKRVYGRVGRDFGPFSRLGEAWYFRHAFEEATAIVSAQDDWCAAADTLGAENMATYLPQDLKWESLGALLRGQVLLNTHCYTVPDLEAFIRHTNEFKFKIRAFHHAHQTYLVPEILKRAYGGRPPAAALFADNMFYKAEAYVASEQAGKILWENGITPVYVSDNPVLNAQHVVFEAAKAYKNGLPYHVALAGVTSASAELLGLGERIGKVKPGFDADIVVWDSDPLSVGATPNQVWIDGTPQFEDPVELKKPIGKAIQPNGDLQMIQDKTSVLDDAVFTGVTKVMIPDHEEVIDSQNGRNVVVRNGKIICVGDCANHILLAHQTSTNIINLQNGHLAPALTAFGSSLGLVEIPAELDTQDGYNGDNVFSKAVDGLALDNKNLEAAYSHGVTRAITAPLFSYGGFKGIGVGFLTGAKTTLEEGAVWADEISLHYSIARSQRTPSISSAIGQLEASLLKAAQTNEREEKLSLEERYLIMAVKGDIPLVITVHSADAIASLLRVKSDVEQAMKDLTTSSSSIRLIILGGAESWMVADSLASADVGVVLAPSYAFRETWEQRRALTGAPLTNGTAIDILHAAGVKVVIGTNEDWETRNLFLSAGIAYANGGGKISEKDALAFVSSNVFDMLGLKQEKDHSLDEFVVFDGNPLQIDGRVRAVADGRGKVTVWT